MGWVDTITTAVVWMPMWTFAVCCELGLKFFCHRKDRAIHDLIGLGKEIWENEDSDEYVRKQRNWDGSDDEESD